MVVFRCVLAILLAAIVVLCQAAWYDARLGITHHDFGPCTGPKPCTSPQCVQQCTMYQIAQEWGLVSFQKSQVQCLSYTTKDFVVNLECALLGPDNATFHDHCRFSDYSTKARACCTYCCHQGFHELKLRPGKLINEKCFGSSLYCTAKRQQKFCMRQNRPLENYYRKAWIAMRAADYKCPHDRCLEEVAGAISFNQ